MELFVLRLIYRISEIKPTRPKIKIFGWQMLRRKRSRFFKLNNLVSKITTRWHCESVYCSNFCKCLHDKTKNLFVLWSAEQCRMPTWPERALPLKLYCRNGEHAAATKESFAVSRNSEMDWCLRELSETHGEIRANRISGCSTGKKRKGFNNAVVLEVATAVMEANNKSFHGTLTLPTISRNLHMPHSNVQPIVRRILNFFPYKI